MFLAKAKHIACQTVLRIIFKCHFLNYFLISIGSGIYNFLSHVSQEHFIKFTKKNQMCTSLLCCRWVEMICRSLTLPLRVCMQSQQSHRHEVEKINTELYNVQAFCEQFYHGHCKLLLSCKNSLAEIIGSFLNSSLLESITEWTYKDLPKPSNNENWEVTQERLTEMVQMRMAGKMIFWENKNKCVLRTKQKLLGYIRKQATALQLEMDRIENIIENMSAGVQITEAKNVKLKFDGNELEVLVSDFESQVVEAVHVIDSAHPRLTHALNELNVHNRIFEAMHSQQSYGNKATFLRDGVGFMRSFSSSSLEHYRRKESIQKLISYQLSYIEQFALDVINNCDKRIMGTISVLSCLTEEARHKNPQLYKQLDTKIDNMLNSIIAFRYINLERYTYSYNQFGQTEQLLNSFLRLEVTHCKTKTLKIYTTCRAKARENEIRYLRQVTDYLYRLIERRCP